MNFRTELKQNISKNFFLLSADWKVVRSLVAIIFLILSIGCSDDTGDITEPHLPSELSNSTWETISDPDAYGWSSAKLQEAFEYSQSIQTAAVIK